MSFYKGTTITQDGRFRNKEKSIIDSKKYPSEFDTKIDINKIELKVIRNWIEKRLTEILGFDDEFLTNFILTLLETNSDDLDPKQIQLQLTGFLNNDAPHFLLELWKLLISAQNSPGGIPEELIKEKEEELRLQSETKSDKIKFLEQILGDQIIDKNKEKFVKEEKVYIEKEKKFQDKNERREIDKKEYKDSHHRDRNRSDRDYKNKKDDKYYKNKDNKNHKDDKKSKRKRSYSKDYSDRKRKSRSRSRSRNHERRR